MRAPLLEWKQQPKTFIIQLWDNKTQSPEGYFSTEKHPKQTSATLRETEKNTIEKRMKAKWKVTMAVFYVFRLLLSPPQTKNPTQEAVYVICNSNTQHDEIAAQQSERWEHNGTCIHGASLVEMGF